MSNFLPKNLPFCVMPTDKNEIVRVSCRIQYINTVFRMNMKFSK